MPNEAMVRRLKALEAYAARLREPAANIEWLPAQALRRATRRDLLLFGVGAAAAGALCHALLPPGALWKSNDPRSTEEHLRQAVERKALAFDDRIDRSLFSPSRLSPTFRKSDITELKNNYAGATPDPSYLADWKLTVDGLARGSEIFDLARLVREFAVRDQITRLVCVEGWNAIAWWSGVPFAQFLQHYPAAPGAKWARLESSVNLDGNGAPDPYFVSFDMASLLHPQTLLATHFNGDPLGVEHGAPLRLASPVKLGLKNIKAITRIRFSSEQPDDYWQVRGYSGLDGL
ncbi:MAG: molybdopterin-dependent oxidoreductase [Acidobacteriaceae bacterium]|nr:molybdopterin-dependent oxidoreductase [Acidobacteriaceae bacterium]